MNDKIQLRRGTLENWLKADPILLDGELALVATDASKPTVYDSQKVGDGTHKFSELEMLGYDCLQELGDSQQFPMSQKAITDWINKGYQFRGVATPSTNPGTPDGPVFYIATEAGTYANFNSISVADGEAVILQWDNGAWTKKTTGFVSSSYLMNKIAKLDETDNEIKEELLAETARFTAMEKTFVSCENDNSDADLNIGDKDGNVILSIKNGHIKTKNFDSKNRIGYQNKYYGQKIEIEEYSFDISTYMIMVNPTGKGSQGMDIWGGVLFSAKDTGYVCLYDFAKKQSNPFATIQLASASAENHSNVLNLAAQKADGSPYPLMYVTVGNVGASIEYYCHVEKIIETDGVYSSQLIQTIILDTSGFSAAGFQSIFGSPQWLLDKVRNQLWVFSAIKRTTEAVTGNMRTNKYVATCFNVPDISSANVTLTANDIVKQSIFEFDAYATQGGCIYNGIIYYTFGFGGTTGNSTSKIRVFDTDSNSILSRINLAGIMNDEPEDCCVYNGKLYMQTAGNSLFVFDF